MALRARQLELYERPFVTVRQQHRAFRPVARLVRPLCAVCHGKPARYGFRDEEGLSPASTLCFECFHSEIIRRLDIAARLSRVRGAKQVDLPLSDAQQSALRRRRAQIAARRALGIR